ncbi:phosphotransferase [Desulforamulus aquiferis]|uniref:protein-tyrosine-phosphatase n=2 Tax=Desulforamulus aquiferis TaxID=1397668 RepID=A0AAW7ZBR7_9FIRM|nr:phosphotransferase [Desulforamulus aquiferis]
MIDIHCHILPCLDDGPESMELSLEMARTAVKEGVTAVIATPHCISGVFYNERKDVVPVMEAFKHRLNMEGIALDIYPGLEIRLEPNIAAKVADRQLLSLCDQGKYLLVELPLSSVPPNTGQVVFECMLKGIRPIIAHPERNKEIIENPQLLFKMLEKGCLVQITSGSITGDFGSGVQNFTKEILKHGWVHFVASDAHHPIKRPLKLKEARLVTAQLSSEDNAKLLFEENPLKVIRGETIENHEVLPFPKGRSSIKKRKGFWSALWKSINKRW